jgi:hypothetical protein
MNGARLRRLILPAEHGSWGFVGEALLLGLAVAPSLAGLLVACSVLSAFLARQPLKVFLGDRWRGVNGPRTRPAAHLSGVTLAIALGAVVAAVAMAGTSILLPAAAAAPLALVQMFLDARGRGRSVGAELCGAVAVGSAASTIALAAGWPIWPAMALWLLLACRSVPAILYVRARLRLERGEKHVRALPITAHVIALMTLVAMGQRWSMPVLVLLPFGLLLLRGVAGLSPIRLRLKARQIGYGEVAYGVTTVVLLTSAYVL